MDDGHARSRVENSKAREKHAGLSRRAAAEGMVLLENRDSMFPIPSGSSIALYGEGAVHTLVCGGGSADVGNGRLVSIYEGLKNAGYQIANEEWLRLYDSKEKVDEAYSEPRERIKKADAHIALFVLSRNAEEGRDRRKEKGDYYLSDEEELLLNEVCASYDRVAVILNTAGVMDLSFMDRHSNILGLIFMGLPGEEAGNALSDIISGGISPSGHLTDTWCYDYEDYPEWDSFSYINDDLSTEKYEEGIYVGYRYFDSLSFPVRYGFGYGLSYTEFELGSEGVGFSEGNIILTVSVRNIGEQPSKEVVQVYGGCPKGRLEKEHRRLIAFKKTDLIPAGATENVSFSIPIRLLSSFDPELPGWVLEEGSYGIWIGDSLVYSKLIGAVKLDKDRVLVECRHLLTSVRSLEEFSIPLEDREKRERELLEELQKNGLSVADCQAELLEGGKYSYGESESFSEEEESIYGELKDEEKLALVVGAARLKSGDSCVGSTSAIVKGAAGDSSAIAEGLGVRSLSFADGPQGLRVDKEYGCTAFPMATILGSSWDRELLREVGAAIACEMEEAGVSVWLGPALNIHRNPLCGRNFEYYSEDPYLSGTMAVAIIEGVQENGKAGACIKHFACNNAEDNRMFSDSVVSERTLREIYLRGFEIAVREAGPKAVMSSYNKINGIHSACNGELLTGVLRDEWGFEGLVISDWTTTWFGDSCSADAAIKAGNDLIMPGAESDIEGLREGLDLMRLSGEELAISVKRVIRLVRELEGLNSSKNIAKE
ncbi:MAG: glycoside hydrolase family 3 C-terminal domain-containing protein [Lachnospiraceae bacterium]|nr:glycoside hydrolase family 3 C-terminal domain-containing protein [Lachnospiraceae bacterium]